MIRLAEKFEKGSICSDNNLDLEGISKTQVDKTNSSFPFTKEKIDNDITEKYLIPSKSITSSKSNSAITSQIILKMLAIHIVKTVIYSQSYHQSQNSPQIQLLTIDLQIYLFRNNR